MTVTAVGRAVIATTGVRAVTAMTVVPGAIGAATVATASVPTVRRASKPLHLPAMKETPNERRS